MLRCQWEWWWERFVFSPGPRQARNASRLAPWEPPWGGILMPTKPARVREGRYSIKEADSDCVTVFLETKKVASYLLRETL